MCVCEIIPLSGSQDEVDELERLLLREYAHSEMSRTISASCQNLASSRHEDGVNKDENKSKHAQGFAQKFATNFGRRIFENEKRKNAIAKRVAGTIVNKLSAERLDVLTKAAAIAKGCGSPSGKLNKKNLMKALALHMAANITLNQKMKIIKAQEEHKKTEDKAAKLNRLNAEFSKSFVKRYIDATNSKSKVEQNNEPERPASRNSRRRNRKLSEHSSVYDLNQFSYKSSKTPPATNRRLYSKPISTYSPDHGKFNANVQRKPWDMMDKRSKSCSPDRKCSSQNGAQYRFPAIKKYANLKKDGDTNLIDLNHH